MRRRSHATAGAHVTVKVKEMKPHLHVSLSWRAALAGCFTEVFVFWRLWSDFYAPYPTLEGVAAIVMSAFALVAICVVGVVKSCDDLGWFDNRPKTVGELVTRGLLGLPLTLVCGVGAIMAIRLAEERVCPHCKTRCWAVENGVQRRVVGL
jgi:hypothetical protein